MGGYWFSSVGNCSSPDFPWWVVILYTADHRQYSPPYFSPYFPRIRIKMRGWIDLRRRTYYKQGTSVLYHIYLGTSSVKQSRGARTSWPPPPAFDSLIMVATSNPTFYGCVQIPHDIALYIRIHVHLALWSHTSPLFSLHGVWSETFPKAASINAREHLSFSLLLRAERGRHIEYLAQYLYLKLWRVICGIRLAWPCSLPLELFSL